jgi:SAM-dependent methyltransferase
MAGYRDARAGQWERWARMPGFDAYWYYRDAFFDRLVPAPAGSTLEVGCGEGRVARDLLARGHAVVAVDASPALVRSAREADARGVYLAADAVRLPLADASFDLVVAYNSLMDVGDLDAALAEISRVLKPDGRLCACVTHPIGDAGHFTGMEPGSPFAIDGTYLGVRRLDQRIEHDGLEMTFTGWCRPLEEYVRALRGAGLVVEALREPAPSRHAQGRHVRWRRVPLFLHLRCRRGENSYESHEGTPGR